MKDLIPYLMFSGNCQEAIKFYKNCFDGKISFLKKYADLPKDAPMKVKKDNKNLIMHVTLDLDFGQIMAADDLENLSNKNSSTSIVHLFINFDDFFIMEKRFNLLKVGGKVKMELNDTFWGSRFGMIQDKFGINWMFNCEIAN